MVRMITKRHQRVFNQNAKLLEAATRYIAMFSSQTDKAAQAASEIELIGTRPTPPTPPPDPEQSRVLLPAGVRSLDEPQQALSQDQIVEWVPDELPDDTTRRVTPDKPAEDANAPGTFERLAGLMHKEAKGSR